MKRAVLTLAVLLAPVSCAAAQGMPQPGADNPRVQTARWLEGESLRLTALPATPLTVMLEPGDEITRIVLDDDRSWAVKVSAELDSFIILPERGAPPTRLTVETARRIHQFEIQTGTGLMAAYLVRIDFAPPTAQSASDQAAIEPGARRWSYRLRGEREVRPFEIFDDGAKTWISFAPDQAMPAIFAIGASGEEEVVNGYTRGDHFVIDRVHEQLVFRIDKVKAVARRQSKEAPGQ